MFSSCSRTPEQIISRNWGINVNKIEHRVDSFKDKWYPNGDGECEVKMHIVLSDKDLEQLVSRGFRTFDSVIRAKEIFGQTSFIVISQRFHNERAVFIAGKKGIDAIALNADDISYGFLTHVREWFARCKVFLDLLFGKRPHFLGEPIDIMRPRPTAMSQQLYEQIIGHVAYEKAQADYAYPDSLTCAGVWFDSRAETDSLYILGGPMAIPDDNFSNGEHFLGYIKDQGHFISFATIGEAFSDALKQHVDSPRPECLRLVGFLIFYRPQPGAIILQQKVAPIMSREKRLQIMLSFSYKGVRYMQS